MEITESVILSRIPHASSIVFRRLSFLSTTEGCKYDKDTVAYLHSSTVGLALTIKCFLLQIFRPSLIFDDLALPLVFLLQPSSALKGPLLLEFNFLQPAVNILDFASTFFLSTTLLLLRGNTILNDLMFLSS